jgi:outer membrane biosynthesis protein TonB
MGPSPRLRSHVKSIRLFLSTSLIATLLGGATLGSSACGSPEKVVESPAPAKVSWGSGDVPGASDESSEAGEGEAEKAAPAPQPADPAPAEADAVEDNAIDLDAPPAKKESPAPAAEPDPEPEAPTADPATEPVAAELQKRRSEKARKAAKGKKRTAQKRESAADAAEPAESASAYKGSDPCRAKTFSVARVQEACSTGGRSAAKRVMKDAIGKATANGQLLKCGDCHSNQRSYALKANAVSDLERWLER